MELDEIDRVIEDLNQVEAGAGTLEECQKRGARYKALTISLRKKVDDLKKANEELVRTASIHQKQMREYKMYAAEEVVDGIKPSLAPVVAAAGKLDIIKNEITSMGKNITEQVKSNTVEIKEISEEVCSAKETGMKGTADVLRTMSIYGLYDRKDSSDLPSAIMEILSLVRSMTPSSTPLLADTDGNIAVTDQEHIGRNTFAQVQEHGSLTVPDYTPSNSVKDLGKERKDLEEKNGKNEEYSSVSDVDGEASTTGQIQQTGVPIITAKNKPSNDIFRPWAVVQDGMSTNQGGVGLLPTPAEFKYIEESFKGTWDMRASAVPTLETPKKQEPETKMSINAPKKQSRQTCSTLPGPVPAKLFQGPHKPVGTSENDWTKGVSLFQTSETPQASTSSPQLTPDILKQMGYKRVNGYVVRAEPSKPKKSRWS